MSNVPKVIEGVLSQGEDGKTPVSKTARNWQADYKRQSQQLSVYKEVVDAQMKLIGLLGGL